MRHFLLSGAFLISVLSFAQNKAATTEDGKKVILKSDKTWEFADLKIQTNKCEVSANFVEPKGESKNQSFLKMVDATTKDLKKHISVDRGCKIEDITLTNLSEQKGNGIYIVCVNECRI
jgi:hypothetical protein